MRKFWRNDPGTPAVGMSKIWREQNAGHCCISEIILPPTIGGLDRMPLTPLFFTRVLRRSFRGSGRVHAN